MCKLINYDGNSYWVYPPKEVDWVHWNFVPENPAVDKPAGKLRKAIKNKAKEMFKLDASEVTCTFTEYAPTFTNEIVYAAPTTASTKENNMCYDCDITPKTDLTRAREYLSERLEGLQYTRRNDERKYFGLTDDDFPKDMEEFVKRIQDGKFVLPEKYKDRSVYNAADHIRWRDPAKKEDKAGFEAAADRIDKAENEARDIIWTLTEKDGLEALRAFEAKTFH